MTMPVAAWALDDRASLAALHRPGADAPQFVSQATTVQIDDGVSYVDELIRRWQLGPPQIRILGAPGFQPRSAFASWTRPDGSVGFRGPTAGVRRLLEDERCTVVVNRWHMFDEACLGLVEDVSSTRGTEAMGNLYLATSTSRSFGRHWDGHDVLVVQLVGRKVWSFFGCEVVDATGRVPQGTPPEAVTMEVELSPGDALLVPRGWWHDTRCPGPDCSLHVSIAGYPFTVSMLLDRLLGEMEPTHQELRRDALALSSDGLVVDDSAVSEALGLLSRQFVLPDIPTNSEG